MQADPKPSGTGHRFSQPVAISIGGQLGGQTRNTDRDVGKPVVQFPRIAQLVDNAGAAPMTGRRRAEIARTSDDSPAPRPRAWESSRERSELCGESAAKSSIRADKTIRVRKLRNFCRSSSSKKSTQNGRSPAAIADSADSNAGTTQKDRSSRTPI